MHSSDLVRMANQIAAYYTSYPRAEALDGIQKHIHSFWEPRMRNAMQAYVEDGGKDLDPLFLAAMHEYFKGPKSPPKAASAAAPAPTAKKKPANAG